MGAECSVDKQSIYTDNEKKQIIDSNSFQDNLTVNQSFSFKNYKDYNHKTELFKKKLQDVIDKAQLLNDFKVVKKYSQ